MDSFRHHGSVRIYIEDLCFDIENVHVFVNESSHLTWTELFGKLGCLQEHEFGGKSEFILYHTEIDIWSILKRFWMCSRLKAHLFRGRRSTLSHDQVNPVDKSKSTCILRLRIMSGGDV